MEIYNSGSVAGAMEHIMNSNVSVGFVEKGEWYALSAVKHHQADIMPSQMRAITSQREDLAYKSLRK